MSDVAVSGREGADGFRPATMLILVGVGIAAFLGLLVLGAIAPDLGSGRNGGSHALSPSANGFSGLLELADATGRAPVLIRDKRQFGTEDLVILTPESGHAKLGDILKQREGKPTLIVMPKWSLVADTDHRGWVRAAGFKAAEDPGATLAPATPTKISRVKSSGRLLKTVSWMPRSVQFRAPRPLQVMSGTGLDPLITDEAGRIVLAQVADQSIYLLADPDLIDNRNLGSLDQAAAALALLDFLNSTRAEHIWFDVTLNGFGASRSPLKLALTPPFLAMTLAIAIAAVLAGASAVARFGPPLRRSRAIAFGKTALIDNAAALVRRARREGALGPRYVALVQAQAAAAFGAPGRLQGDELGDYLDRLSPAERFSELADGAASARTSEEMLAATQALHNWIRETKR